MHPRPLHAAIGCRKHQATTTSGPTTWSDDFKVDRTPWHCSAIPCDDDFRVTIPGIIGQTCNVLPSASARKHASDESEFWDSDRCDDIRYRT